MSEDIVPAVKAVIENEKGEILALRTRAESEDYWVLPGGKVEYGESPEEALRREIQEELSCKISIGNAVGMYYFFTGKENDGKQVVLTAFEGSISGEVDISGNPADENIEEFRWLSIEDLKNKSDNESLKRLLEKYIEENI